MLTIAFVQCYHTVHDLHWASEPDFDRDIAYIRATLNGDYGKDPSMLGQYMWYNPIIFITETLIVKITGLPINVVVARCGAFLNIINPIVFFFVLIRMFDYKVALASLLCFVFLICGNLPCWGAATYSPWMVSDTAVQWLFYLSILCCYKAFDSQKMGWFITLGVVLGITFLGHSAPVFIVVFILLIMQGQKVFIALKDKQYKLVGAYFLQGAVTIIPFIIFAFPMLYYVYGKYHLHFVNRIILECAPGVFARKETIALLKLNVTVALVISIIGFIWFYLNFKTPVLRKLIWCWLGVTLVMYIYESAVPTVDKIIHHDLPDTIPAFHYFFYFKALQCVFFGFGFMWLFNLLIKGLSKLFKKEFSERLANNLFVFAILVYTVAYFPVYRNRWDFSDLRQESLNKEKQTDKLDIYNFIVNSVPLDNVLLCPHGLSLFPVMPTAIKMVSVETYFSNPYVSYDQREGDRVKMLNFLTTSTPDTAKNMFSKYKVSDVLLSNDDYKNYKEPSFANSLILYKNSSYTLLSFDIKK